MAEKDVVLNTLLSQPDVFADVMNLVLFNGNKVIQPESLSSTHTTGSTLHFSDGSQHKNVRDVAFKHDSGVALYLLGCENQVDIKKDMLLCIAGYDGATYQE